MEKAKFHRNGEVTYFDIFFQSYRKIDVEKITDYSSFTEGEKKRIDGILKRREKNDICAKTKDI